MPPPSSSGEIYITSARDQESECNCETSKVKPYQNFCKDESQVCIKKETIKFVKTLLGPSLEDTVLRTLEFGRSIINQSDGIKLPSQEKQILDVLRKEIASPSSQKDLDLNFIFEEGKKIMKDHKTSSKRRSVGKFVSFKSKLDKNLDLYQKPVMKKLATVSKIRSLDSDLKQDSPSPENIKRQLEALIQINKDEVQKREGKWNLSFKPPKYPVEMTIMPSICMYNTTEADVDGNCDNQSNISRPICDCGCECSGDGDTSRPPESPKKSCPSKICQAPEFLSNALGPTLDVSIIDNLKLIRGIFKCDNAKGEGSQKQPCSPVKQEVCLQNSELEMNCRIEELQKKIEELEHKEQCLTKRIEDEERERNSKRKAFEEEKKLSAVKSCFEKFGLKKGDSEKNTVECCLEFLKMKVATEEEKLIRLKNQSECFKRELADAKHRKESLKRNKCLLDAWDVFASRVCHTKLPSFSSVYCLERKTLKGGDTGNLHCCFPSLPTETSADPCSKCQSGKSESLCSSKLKNWGFCRTPSRCNNFGESHDVSRSCSRDRFESQSTLKCKLKMGEIQFPIQRDVVCGLHQLLKSCLCKVPTKHEGHTCSSEDDLIRKLKTMKSKCDVETRKSPSIRSEKHACRSKSDTSLKINKCPKIVKVMWATTRINVFQDNSRTYEVMDATPRPPTCLPVRTEGIFVVKTPQRKVCPHSPKKNSSSWVSGF